MTDPTTDGPQVADEIIDAPEATDPITGAPHATDPDPTTDAPEAADPTDPTAGPATPAEVPEGEVSLGSLEREGDIAADYLEGLLDIADLDGDIDIDVEGDRAAVAIVGESLELLVGTRGEALEALQELTRLAVHQQTGVRSRLMLDVGGYRVRRRAELAELGRRTAEEVKRAGAPTTLPVMTPFERKVVHDAVAQISGVRSESEGVDPERRVTVLPG